MEFKMAWYNAFMFCQQFNMNLMTIRTREEQTHIFDIMKHPFFKQKKFLIGASNLGSSDDFWYWMKNSETINFQMKWLPEEPSNFENGNKKSCLAISSDGDNIGFQNVDCSHKLNLLCDEIPSQEVSLNKKIEL